MHSSGCFHQQIQNLQNMGTIYKDSIVIITITAVNAKTVHEGFPRDWSVDHQHSVLPLMLPSIRVVQCRLSRTSGWWPLDRRAWTLQDHLLYLCPLSFGTGYPSGNAKLSTRNLSSQATSSSLEISSVCLEVFSAPCISLEILTFILKTGVFQTNDIF
jgi:hypothetical protein